MFFLAFCAEKANWVRNIRANPDKVKVQVRFKSFQAHVEIIESFSEKIKYLEWMVTKLPKEAKTGFGWVPKQHTIGNLDFTSLAEFLTLIKLHNPKS